MDHMSFTQPNQTISVMVRIFLYLYYSINYDDMNKQFNITSVVNQYWIASDIHKLLYDTSWNHSWGLNDDIYISLLFRLPGTENTLL